VDATRFSQEQAQNGQHQHDKYQLTARYFTTYGKQALAVPDGARRSCDDGLSVSAPT
jgi:hypothetical protein